MNTSTALHKDLYCMAHEELQRIYGRQQFAAKDINDMVEVIKSFPMVRAALSAN